MKRFLTFSLVLILCMSMVSCGFIQINKKDKNTDEGNDAERVITDTEPMLKEAVNTLNSLPSANLKSGYGVGIVSNGSTIFVPESAGSKYSEAIEKRNSLFEYKYNTTLNQVTAPTDEILNEAFENMLAGLYYTDLFAIEQKDLSLFKSRSVLLPIDSLYTIDLNKSFFDKNAISQINGSGGNYALYGTLNRDYSKYYCLYINRDILGGAGLSMPYEEVKNGTWTWDKLIEIVKLVTSVNPNVLSLASNDENTLTANIFLSSGNNFTANAEGTLPTLAYGNEAGDKALSALREIASNRNFLFDFSARTGSARDDFKAGRALFYIGTLGEMKDITTMVGDFCILPMPKHSSEQESYYTTVDSSYPAICVYAGVENSEKAVSMLYGLYGASSGDYLANAYYYELIDTSIRDGSALDMLDYICPIKGGKVNIDFTNAYKYADGVSYHTSGALFRALNTPYTAKGIAEENSPLFSEKMRVLFP